jgi:hypothetical protein
MIDLRWMWLFLDTPEEVAEEAWEFWRAVTGSTLSEPRGETGQFATLLPGEGDPWLKLQRVGGGGGLHFDLDSTDRAASLAAALGAGAAQRERYHDVEVMTSPGGFAFCLTLGEGGDWVRGPRTMLDQVCVDIPPRLWDSEVEFWASLTGMEAAEGRTPDFRRLLPPRGRPMRMLLQRLQSDADRVTAHPDFASADRAADTEAHVGLGAEVVRAFEAWTVMRAPGGQVYCLTDRDPATGLLR